ncbi:formylglycine-generating enzyme family protein [Tolypothrix sp. PCC 7910]|uniref:formylglycine-generating enzyme family protein n=1 Tax=Tolypothrix sp. PCC 7910 TaxID=2099387 RepID=UPI0014278C90|nr:formylglycine-generating enzyme family protein [Tolypothrix sp. PCC 7910]QIR36916.1 formylglycine-generating enzyme family protein [Tolypothrix sp. PCC 7910]
MVTVNSQGKEIESYQGQACCLKEELGNGLILEMVYIPAGQFWMGSPESEGKRYSNEKPQHLAKIEPFLMSKYPITQMQWKQIASLPQVSQKLKLRPSRQGGNNHPITQVSWFDAMEFCDRLSHNTGHKYRLPSEAEWEYACRAGTTTPFHFGETLNFNLANYDATFAYRSEPKGIYREKTSEVGSFQVANSFGLFDMHGLVWEWCLDNWHQNYDKAPTNGDAWLESDDNNIRLMRGGSWRNEPFLCRSSSRQFNYASEMLNNVGFRIVRTL